MKYNLYVEDIDGDLTSLGAVSLKAFSENTAPIGSTYRIDNEYGQPVMWLTRHMPVCIAFDIIKQFESAQS